jgi:ATP-dependent DNA helicase RecG
LSDHRRVAKTIVKDQVTLEDPASQVSGIGDSFGGKLERLGINTVRDLLFHLPRRYDDTRAVVPLNGLQPGETQTVRVRVRNVSSRLAKNRRLLLIEATLDDGSGTTALARWFGNQGYLVPKLHQPGEFLISGPVERSFKGFTFRNPRFERAGDDQRHVGTLAPVYAQTAGISSVRLRGWIDSILDLAGGVADALPESVRGREQLMPIADALRQVHKPDDPDSAQRARERIAFEEFFLLHIAGERARRRRSAGVGIAIPYDVELARRFAAALPFRLTDGQRITAHEVLTDLAGAGPMNRLLQGDVGSGKTVVAAMAALMTHNAGSQTAVMAPTEILARQHYATLDQLLSPHGLPPRLLVGSTSAAARREVLEGVAAGHDALIVGTHALIEDDVIMDNLGLAVVDEQQRFGVAQRARLRQKSGAMPNYLALTATPIPRSLHLTLYGDVDVSELREMPPGRRHIETRLVPPYERAQAYDFVRDHVRSGRQVFVICPLIEESDKLGARSATAEYERLRTHVFPDLRVELLHGRMPAREKEERMGRFGRGDADILVSTSVVEVGVDVPNASIMIIEGAERFGLAQLHQFRGRVGRDEHQSYCLLFQGGVDDEGSQRLEQIARTDSGFEVAELDLRLRGPGDVGVVGLRQHGLPEMQAADLLDVALSQRARAAALRWLDEDAALTRHPPLTEAMDAYRSVFDLD